MYTWKFHSSCFSPYPSPTFFFPPTGEIQLWKKRVCKHERERERERGTFPTKGERRTKHGGKDTRLIYLHRFIATEQIISAGGVTSAVNHHLIGPHRESITRTILFPIPPRFYPPFVPACGSQVIRRSDKPIIISSSRGTTRVFNRGIYSRMLWDEEK